MTDTLLWDLAEAARQLGGVSTRTVRRLIERGEFQGKKVGARLMVRSESVRSYLDAGMTLGDNPCCAGPDVRETSICGSANNEIRTDCSNGRIRRTGGRHTRTLAVRELDALLAPKSDGRRKHY
jgi:excisionase family DNA binding protein